jgi:hypothetical protein
MLNKDHMEVVAFVLEQIDRASGSRKARIYRGLADLCGDDAEAKELRKMASDIEAVDHRCQEFAFKFNRKKESL